MATILQQNQGAQQEEKDKAIFSSTAQTSQVGAGQGQPASGQAAQKGPSSSGRFSNIQNFIRANQSGRIGEQVTEKVGSEKQKATQKLQETKDAFGGQIGSVAAGVAKSKEDVNKGIQDLTAGGTYAAQTPVAEQAISSIQGALSKQYEGPQQLGNEQILAGEAQNLGQIGQASKTEGGRAALLQRFFGRERPTYTSGQTRLDNLLLGRQNQALADVRQAGKVFGTQVSQEQQAAQKAIQEQQQNIKQLQESTTSQATATIKAAEQRAIQDAMDAGRQAEQKAIQDLEKYGNLDLTVDLGGQTPVARGKNDLPPLWADRPTVAKISASLTPQDYIRLGVDPTSDFVKQLKSGNLVAASQLNPERANTFAKLAETVRTSTGLRSGQTRQSLEGVGIDPAKLADIKNKLSQNITEEFKASKVGGGKLLDGNLLISARKQEQGLTKADPRRSQSEIDKINAFDRAITAAKNAAVQRVIGRMTNRPTITEENYADYSGGLGRTQMRAI